jgi:SAM-dependent methyltransferase
VTGTAIGWDHPDTARYYAAFDRRHGRYREANRMLVRHAVLAPGQRLLDVAAGTGGTAAAALTRVPTVRIVCFEPAAAMREAGKRSLRDDRVTWTGEWPAAPESFDRVLCGAAIWQLPLEHTFARIFALLRPGGCFAFDVPSLYLGEPDAPGQGKDPLLQLLPAVLAEGRGPSDMAAPGDGVPAAAAVDAMLARAGFGTTRWGFELPFSQEAYRDWLKIPVTTNGILSGLGADERAHRIDQAFHRVPADSWRRERWTGWSAWKPSA